jgi:RNA polymerase sigma-70 factor (sigma-E family)
LHQAAYRLCGDWHEAEDLVQVALYRIYYRWDQLNTRDHLAAYARQTVLNVFISEHRRLRWQYETSSDELPDGGQIEPSIGDLMAVRAAVNQLPPRQRAVIALRFWDDLSVEQAAAVLDCSTGTVTSQTYRALKNLRLNLVSSDWLMD